MPEQITKHPETTLEVLKGAGARCGEGLEQKILKECPADRFCALPTGEMCIYGISDIPRMTQIEPQELAAVVCPPPGPMKGSLLGSDLALALAALLAGIAFGGWLRRRR